MEAKDLKKLQKYQMVITDEFVKFCDENNIDYYLLGGSALGAVRHNGFIPWDDDMDVGLMRKDYEFFLENYVDNVRSIIQKAKDKLTLGESGQKFISSLTNKWSEVQKQIVSILQGAGLSFDSGKQISEDGSKIEQLRTVKSIVSAACQKFVENMELFTHKIRTFKEEPQNEIL